MGEQSRRQQAGTENAHERVVWRRDERKLSRSAAAEIAKLATPLDATEPTDTTRKASPSELEQVEAIRDEIVRNVLESDLSDQQILDIALSKSKQLVHASKLNAFIRKLRVVRASREQAAGDLVAQGIVARQGSA